jgi:predicted phage terminase large subunit-like protein
MINIKNNEEIEFLLEQIKDPLVRTQLTRENHFLFFHIYMGSYVTYRMAPFHREIFNLTEDTTNPLTVICAFRGSGKSTLMTLSYALWAILGVQQKKFVVILSQTQDQSGQLFKNLKRELEENNLLKADLGPFQEDNDWNANSLVIPKYNARITIASTEQKIRGIRHRSYRPDLILADDVEDSNSVKTLEGRNKIYNWFTKEILPLGDNTTKFVVVGNLLHNDSLLMRLKQEIEAGTRSGIFRAYPLINASGKCLWRGKYPNKKAIEDEILKIGDKFSWHQEYLLQILDNREAVIEKKWIHTYPNSPESIEEKYYAIGVDPAIKDTETADFTGIVSAKVVKREDSESTIYILPNPINAKMQAIEIPNCIKTLVSSFGGRFSAKIYVESVAFQEMLIQSLKEDHFNVEEFKPGMRDKRTRLIMVSSYIQSGKVLFPEKGAEELITQLLNFGFTEHDDLVDAFTTLIMKIINEDNKPQPRIRFI